MDTHNALRKISGHEFEEPDLACTHVLQVAVFLPLPAALTTMPSHLQYVQTQSTVTAQIF
jgi:hypothetical protein